MGDTTIAPRSAHDLPEVYESLGIDLNALGCIMLSLAPQQALIDEGLGLHAADLYVSPNPKLWWVRGDVGAQSADPETGWAGPHATLLYGLLPKIIDTWNRAPIAVDQTVTHEPWGVTKEHVTAVMSGWEPPLGIEVHHIEAWPSPVADEPYVCLAAALKLNDSIIEAHQRLSYLPHLDTHPVYRPHVTLAYVKAERAQHWKSILELQELLFTVDYSGHPQGLDYGVEIGATQ